MNKFKQWLIEAVARRLPPCEEITHRLSESLDRRMSLKERFILRLHLMTCTWCTKYGRQITFISEAAGSSRNVVDREEKPRARLPEEARQAIKRRLANPDQ